MKLLYITFYIKYFVIRYIIQWRRNHGGSGGWRPHKSLGSDVKQWRRKHRGPGTGIILRAHARKIRIAAGDSLVSRPFFCGGGCFQVIGAPVDETIFLFSMTLHILPPESTTVQNFKFRPNTTVIYACKCLI